MLRLAEAWFGFFFFNFICLFFGCITRRVGILVPQPGIKPMPPALDTTGPPGKSLCIFKLNVVLDSSVEQRRSVLGIQEENMLLQGSRE